MNITSIILRVLAVAGAIAAVVLFMQINEFHEEMETEISQTQEQIQASEANLAEMTEDRDSERARADGLENDLSDARDEISQLNRNLEQTQRELEDTERDLRGARQEISRLEDERDELNQRNSELDRQIARMEDDHERDMARLRQQVVSLEDELQEAQEATEVAELDWDDDFEEFEEEEDFEPVESVRGTIAAVGSESSFVILDKGSEEGLYESLQLAIFRDNRAIARIEVSEIRDDLAIAQVMPGTLERSIRMGDSYRTLD